MDVARWTIGTLAPFTASDHRPSLHNMALWYSVCGPEFHRRDCRSKQRGSPGPYRDQTVFVATAEDELRSHLDSGEKLLWAGRPAQGMVLTTPRDWTVSAFGVVWLGFGVYNIWQTRHRTR